MTTIKIQKNPIVFIELECDFKSKNRLVFELFGDVVPRTVENFLQIARGDANDLNYVNTTLHVKQDGLYGSAKGSPERSIFGKGRFMNESFVGNAGKHAGFGTLYCYNNGKGNATEFHVSTSEKNCSKERQCVVMGKMIEGQSLLSYLMELKTVRVTKCGEQRLASSMSCPREPFRIYCCSEENKSEKMEDLAKMWRTQMSEEQKKMYVEMSKRERDIYDAEVARVLEIEKMEELARRDGGKNRRRGRKRKKIANTAFNFFCLEKQKAIKATAGNVDDSEVTKTLSEMWEKMDGAARLPYIEMEKKENEERKRQRLDSTLYSPNTPIQFLQNNPKQPTSMSYARYEKYKVAKTIKEYFELGGTRADLKYDTSRGYMRILDVKNKDENAECEDEQDGGRSNEDNIATTVATTTARISGTTTTTTTTTTNPKGNSFLVESMDYV